MSSAAVHLADAAIMQRAEDARVMLKLAVEAMAHEEKDRAQSEKKGREEHHHEEEAELVPEKVVEYLYFDLPHDQSSLYERIKVWLPILDWPAIHADARYWVEESSVQELFSTTCVSLVADSLNEVLGVMFNFNLLSTLRSEIEIPANEERHDYIMAIIVLVAARLGVLLGSSVQPDALPMTLIRDRSADLYRGSALEVIVGNFSCTLGSRKR